MFLKRRGPFLSTGILGIFVTIVVAVRMFVGIVTRHDVHLGIEMLLKNLLSLKQFGSMLQNEKSITQGGLTKTRSSLEEGVTIRMEMKIGVQSVGEESVSVDVFCWHT